MCGSYARIQLSRESGSQLVNMAGYQLEVILPIVVLFTVVARVLISREPDMILRYRRNQLLHAARLSVRMPSCFWHFRQNAASPLGYPKFPQICHLLSAPRTFPRHISEKKSVVITVYPWKSDSLHKRTGSDLIKKWNFRSSRFTYGLARLRPSVIIAELRQTERSHWLIRILIHTLSRIRIRVA